MDHFLPFYPHMDPENQNFQKNGKNTWKYYHFTNINNSHMMCGSWDMEHDRHNFLPFYHPLDPENKNFQKNGKKMKKWRYYHFTHVYHKQQSYDVWFLRYGAWRTEFLVILDHFLHFYPPNNPKNQNFE